MATFEVRHTLNIGEEEFWSQIFFDEEFNRKLYREKLDFHAYEVVEDREEGGERMRKIRAEPPANAPGPIKKIVGDSLSYVEDGRWDPSSKRYRFTVVPSKMSDKVKTTGELWVEPRGDKQVERVVSMTVEAKIFGVGKMLESFIESSTRESYSTAARFTNQWIAEKGL